MRALWITAIFAFAADQISKYVVFHVLDWTGRDQIDIVAPFLVFRTGLNTGINFGLLSGANIRWALLALSIVVSVALFVWARRKFHRPIEFMSTGLVIGGALGNAVDRIFYPGVLDFLNMSCCGINNPYIFNVADVFIFAGAIGIALFAGDKKAA